MNIPSTNLQDDRQAPTWLLTVAAKSLQSYVLSSDKLKEIVGATQLIEDFSSRDFAASLLQDFGFHGEVLMAAAGQLRIGLGEEASARGAAAIWPWIAHRLAPGMDVHVAVADTGKGLVAAIEECERQISISRNLPVQPLPLSGPLADRNQRSGHIAAHMDREPEEVKAAISSEAFVKRRRRRKLRETNPLPELFRTFGISIQTLPESFDEISVKGSDDRPYLAILHADGNGFGKLWIDLGREVKDHLKWDEQRALKFFRSLSQAIRDIGHEAAKSACGKLKARVDFDSSKSPFIPIVFAGDDLTLVLRADIAWDFAKDYLEAFEAKSEKKLDDLRKEFCLDGKNSLPKKLTAGAAIVFCKPSYPFAQAYELCESIASSKAKGERTLDPDRNPRSAIAFHRISASSAPTDFSEVECGELTCARLINEDHIKPRKLILSGAPYFLHGVGRTVSQLDSLVAAMRPFPAGARRQILSDLRTNHADASARLARMINVAKNSTRTYQEDDLPKALEAIHGGDAAPLWAASDDGEHLLSSIGDAMTLIEVTRNHE